MTSIAQSPINVIGVLFNFRSLGILPILLFQTIDWDAQFTSQVNYIQTLKHL